MRLGLVLGAGAARGLAYIGVIRVLEKNGIKPDYIMGISIGAVIGAYYALYGEIDSIMDKVKFSRREVFAMMDVKRPVKSLIGGRKIKTFWRKQFKNKTFDDLKMPLGVITTDLEAGEEYVITKGKLLKALMASAAVPGLLPPVKMDKRWLVDGDVAHCNPVELIKKHVDKVIYVDVMTDTKKKIKKLNIVKTLIYSYDVKRKKVLNDIQRRKDTVVIKPNVSDGFNYMEFSKYDKFIFEGQKATLRKIKEIKRLINR